MRWFALILGCAVLSQATAAPEPKKYKPEVKEGTKSNSSLTNEEKQFLREVEAKFGIKSDVSVEDINNAETTKPTLTALPKAPFPAVIAIEIVNDTDTKNKGKRTIDANLGYGYRTNNGYSYSYFGKPNQDKGKFVLYPYSQEDIPPRSKGHSKHSSNKYHTSSPNVEIQPSQAYELVPVKEEEQTSYEYKRPVTEFKSKYENVKGLESPPPPYKGSSQTSPPSTLYTTYNGENFSGLSGQFPMVMPNYFVEPSQLLKNPQYQSAGLTDDHLRTHGAHLEQRVVPVLVLRIPSSYLKNPSAELYANLPQNYPLSQYLNNVNLQQLVNQYFTKIGYSTAPQIMAYPHSPISAPVEAPAPVAVSHYEPQHYANPYVRPSYTNDDYSGVQYSAVQPVMAKYPSSYPAQQYYISQNQPVHQQPIPNQQYDYRYQYVTQPEEQQPTYYVDQEYEQQISQQSSNEQTSAEQETVAHDPPSTQYGAPQESHSHGPTATQYGAPQESHSHVSAPTQYGSPQESQGHAPTSNQYGAPQESDAHGPTATQYGAPQASHVNDPTATQYGPPHESAETTSPQPHKEYGLPTPHEHYESHSTESPAYEHKLENTGYPSKEYGPTKVTVSPFITAQQYGPPSETKPHQVYYSPQSQQPVQKETIALFPSQNSATLEKHLFDPESGVSQRYFFQKQVNDDSASKTLVISENYPSRDHTIATVLPQNYKSMRKQNKGVQSVNYVTPTPLTSKYLSRYNVMVPQTVLSAPKHEKVSYVNSHSLPMHFLQVGSSSADYNNPEAEYTLSSQYAPSVGSQKPPSYPRNYHTQPKRMVRPENKPETSVSQSSLTSPRKRSEKTEKKKST